MKKNFFDLVNGNVTDIMPRCPYVAYINHAFNIYNEVGVTSIQMDFVYLKEFVAFIRNILQKCLDGCFHKSKAKFSYHVIGNSIFFTIQDDIIFTTFEIKNKCLDEFISFLEGKIDKNEQTF